MKKTKLNPILTIISLVVITAVIIIVQQLNIFSNPKTINSNSDLQLISKQEPEQIANNTPGQTAHFSDFLRFSSPQTCYFVQNQQNVEVSGNIYISYGQFYAQINTSIENQPMITNVIYDKETLYTWLQESVKGYKISYIRNQKLFDFGEIPINDQILLNFSCKPWSEDLSVFKPPKEILFSKYEQIPQPTQLPSGNENKCAVCQDFREISRQFCLVSLKCI